MNFIKKMIKKKIYIIGFLIAILITPILKVNAIGYDSTMISKFAILPTFPLNSNGENVSSILKTLTTYLDSTTFKYILLLNDGGTNYDTFGLMLFREEIPMTYHGLNGMANTMFAFRNCKDPLYNDCSTHATKQNTKSLTLNSMTINATNINNLINDISSSSFSYFDNNYYTIYSNKEQYFGGFTSTYPPITWFDQGYGVNYDLVLKTNYNMTLTNYINYATPYFMKEGVLTKLNLGDKFPSINDYNAPLPTTTDYMTDQLFSIDSLISDNLPHDIEFSFYLKEEETWIIDSFDTYRLYENNGLYHYEKATTTDKMCAMTDYIETVNDNKQWTIKLFDLTCDTTDGAIGFYYKVNLTNALDYAFLDIKSNISFANNYSWDHIIKRFNTSQFKYINFSTNLDNYSATWHIKSFDHIKSPAKEIFFTYFNLDTLDFFDYSDELSYLSNPTTNNVLIGRQVNRGITLNRKNTDIWNEEYNHFNFEIALDPNNLYYSIAPNDGSAANDNTTIVDGNGEPIGVIIDIEDGIPTIKYDGYKNLITNINKFTRDYKLYINEFFSLFTYGFNKLDPQIKNFIIIIFSTITIFVIVSRIRK